MKNASIPIALSIAVLIYVSGCSGPSSEWNGRWKLEQSKSSISLPTFTFAVPSPGEYRYEAEDVNYAFRCDGKEYPTYDNYVLSCRQTSANAFDATTKKGGSDVSDSHWEVSSDGRLLTIKWNATQPGGGIKPVERVFDRTSGSNGFAGGWRETKSLESRPQLLLVELHWRSLRVAFPQAGQHADPRLDGSDAKVYSPTASPGFTMSIKSDGPREFLIDYRRFGKMYREGSMKLAADGRTLISETWHSGNPGRKDVLVYQKQ